MSTHLTTKLLSVIGLVLVTGLGLLSCSGCKDFDKAVIVEEGNQISRSLLEFMVKEGRSPKSLEECGVFQETLKFNPWLLVPYPNQIGVQLSTGDFLKCDWEATRTIRLTEGERVGRMSSGTIEEAAQLVDMSIIFFLENGAYPDSLGDLGVGSKWGQHGPWVIQKRTTPEYYGGIVLDFGVVLSNDSYSPICAMSLLDSGWWFDTT